MSAFPDVPSWYMELSAQGQDDAMRFIHAHDSLRAELAASESLVSALQEQMARLAEQHAKAVAEAREEQREHDARLVEAPERMMRYAKLVAADIRATPLDSTPLSARIAELETRNANLSSSAESWRKAQQEAESALAAEVERHQATAKIAREALERVDAMEDQFFLVHGPRLSPSWQQHFHEADDIIKEALASLPAGPRVVR